MSRDDDASDSDRAGDAPLPRETQALFGHKGAEAQLLEGYRQGRLAHAWIIGGAEGIGKATLAWRFARFLLVHPDADHSSIRSASDLSVSADHPIARRVANGGHGNVFVLRRELNDRGKMRTEIAIETVRKLIEFFHLSAAEGGWRVCIVDSAEDLNRNSANALLKLIEEPPARSLFLIVAHKPGLVMPTIRSRCRSLLLERLTPDAMRHALTALQVPASQQQTMQAIDRADGSVKEALRLLDPGNEVFDRKLQLALSKLPQLDWRAIHSLSDNVAGRAGEGAYESLVQGVMNHVSRQVHTSADAGAGIARLQRLAHAWDEIGEAIRQAEALNLDKKALVIGLFLELAKAG